MTTAVLRFPEERLASFTCSFGAADVAAYQVVGTKGDVRVDPAYEYAAELKSVVTVDGKKRTREYAKRDQFAPELLHFSDCVLTGRDPQPGGREGLADVRIIRALYRSARDRPPGAAGRLQGPAAADARQGGAPAAGAEAEAGAREVGFRRRLDRPATPG